MSESLTRRDFFQAALAMASAPLLAPAARAGGVPLRIVVGFAPGGASSAVTRALGAVLEAVLRRPVIVESRAGADGVLAAQAVAAAAPDGNTLLLGSNTALVAVPALRSPPPYDPFAAFLPVSSLGRFSMSLLVHAAVPARTVAGLLALMERRPGELNAAASNSTAELAVAQLKGWRQVQTVPYKGDAAALLDLVAGRVHLMFATGASAEPFIAEGRLRRLGSTAPGGGLAVDVTPWLGLFAPAGLTDPALTEIARAVAVSLQDAALRRQFSAQGFEPHAMTVPEFQAYFRVQYARFVASARRASLRLDR